MTAPSMLAGFASTNFFRQYKRCSQHRTAGCSNDLGKHLQDGSNRTHDPVVPLNDSPTLRDAQVFVLEDSEQPSGQSIGDMLDSKFTDPDDLARLSGVAVIANPQRADQGTWYFSSTFGTTWTPIGTVDDNQLSLAISRNDWIGFLPAPDYYGTPEPLTIRGLDNSYDGRFSRSNFNCESS